MDAVKELHDIIRAYCRKGIMRKLESKPLVFNNKRKAIYEEYGLGDKDCIVTNYFEDSLKSIASSQGKLFRRIN